MDPKTFGGGRRTRAIRDVQIFGVWAEFLKFAPPAPSHRVWSPDIKLCVSGYTNFCDVDTRGMMCNVGDFTSIFATSQIPKLNVSPIQGTKAGWLFSINLALEQANVFEHVQRGSAKTRISP